MSEFEKVAMLGLTYDDVLLLPGPSEVVPSEVETETWLTRKIKLSIPLVSSAMDTVTESQMAIALAKAGGIGIIHRNLAIDEQVTHVKLAKNVGLVGAAVGVGEDGFKRAQALIDAGVDVVVVDTAHGHHRAVLDAIERVKKFAPDTQVIGGNIATRSGAQALINAGADAVKVGVGPGSICTTRLETGIGKGQFSSVLECFQAKQSNPTLKAHIICDGGSLGKTGNKVKALAAGSVAVMLGRTLASTEESPGQIIYRNGKRFKYIRGMASTMANLSKQEKTNTKKLKTNLLIPRVSSSEKIFTPINSATNAFVMNMKPSIKNTRVAL